MNLPFMVVCGGLDGRKPFSALLFARSEEKAFDHIAADWTQYLIRVMHWSNKKKGAPPLSPMGLQYPMSDSGRAMMSNFQIHKPGAIAFWRSFAQLQHPKDALRDLIDWRARDRAGAAATLKVMRKSRDLQKLRKDRYAGPFLNALESKPTGAKPSVAGASVNARKKPEMVQAILSNDRKLVKALVAEGYDLNRDERGAQCGKMLAAAIIWGTAEMVALLIKLGADPNFRDLVLDGEARSCFHIACARLDEKLEHTTPEHVFELLKGGAQIDESSYAFHKLAPALRDKMYKLAERMQTSGRRALSHAGRPSPRRRSALRPSG